MAKVGLAEAAKLTGKSQSTIHRAMAAHKLAFEINEHGERVIDTSELDRLYPIAKEAKTAQSITHATNNDARQVTQSDLMAVQLEGATVRIADLQRQIAGLEADKEDLRRERDKLQTDLREERAQIRLLTDQREKAQTVAVASSRGWRWPWSR